jgi:hypothetical protein
LLLLLLLLFHACRGNTIFKRKKKKREFFFHMSSLQLHYSVIGLWNLLATGRPCLKRKRNKHDSVIGSWDFQACPMSGEVYRHNLYTPHTCWCGPPMNDSYQQGALFELF